MRVRRVGWVVLALVLWGMTAGSVWGASPSPPTPSEVRRCVEGATEIAWPVRAVMVAGEAVTVCLGVPPTTLREGSGMGAEAVTEAVRRALTPLAWRSLYVQAVDAGTGACRPLSDFLPAAAARPASPRVPVTAPAPTPTAYARSLAGKTIYVSAGHGWQWRPDYNSSAPEGWATQRPVTEGIIEDHNNAEAVDQFLIPYLERAGATVIPVRERDWRDVRLVVAAGGEGYTEAGVWQEGAEGIRLAAAVTGTATATATWTLTLPQAGRYALYAWVVPGPDRVPDARYAVWHAGGVAQVLVDQRIRGATWRHLGTFPFRAGAVTVTLSNASAFTGVVAAGALRVGSGLCDDLTGIETAAPYPPDEPWWETAAFYYAQWMGLEPALFPYFNDVVARPMFARWNHWGTGEDAVYISWHTNGYDGTVRGTESYIHNGETYPPTEGSAALQQAVHDELIHDIRVGWEADWVDRGKKAANLGELRMLWDEEATARMPGVLIEVAFHDHPDDAAALKDPRFNRLAARAIYQGILHYFEARDGVDLVALPEPPTHLRVRNDGVGRVTVAWQPSPTDTVGLRGEAATAYRVYTSTDGFAWHAPLEVTATAYTFTGLAAGERFYVRVTAVNEGGESFPTEVLGVRVAGVGGPPLLIVDGFDKLNRFGLVRDADPRMGENGRMWVAQMNARDYVVHHGEAVPPAYSWDSASNEAVAAGLVPLARYAMVDWLLGEESLEEDGTLDGAERTALRAFVEGGGALFLSGSEWAWDLVAMGRDPDFVRQVLHADYVADDAETYTVTATAAGALAGLEPFTFDAPGEYDADFPDVLRPPEGAAVALTYTGGTGGAAAVQASEGCRRTLVMGFPLEVVRSEARGEVMGRVLGFLDECAETQVRISSPQAGGYYSVTPPFRGEVLWGEAMRVEVRVASAEGRDWDGGAWVTGTHWLAATGTVQWSYPLPPLGEGGYTVAARAVTTAGVASTATVAFVVDRTPPQAPRIITPTGSMTLWLPVLQWSPPPDEVGPLHYELEVDGVSVVTEETVWVARGLTPGRYVWRVRAVDAAGNVGAWSAWATFYVSAQAPHRLYLPLVVRGG